MWETIFHIGKDNWVFVEYVKGRTGLWRALFSQNVHADSKVILSWKKFKERNIVCKYDEVFYSLMTFRTDTKKELREIVEQFAYQIENGEI